MNVGDLKDTIAAFLQVPVADTIQNGMDLCMLALNNAKKKAERMHDWNCEEVSAYGGCTDGLGAWGNMTIVNDDASTELIALKQVQSFYLETEDGQTLVPLLHHTKKHGAVWAKERLEARGLDSAYRHRGDSSVANELIATNGRNGYRHEVFVQGKKYEIHPNPAGERVVWVDAYRWLPAYSSDDDEDFFTEQGHDYLMYAGIVELNLLFQTFIPQAEGNLAPPEKARDTALAGLIEFDNFIVESGRQPSR